MEGMVVQTSRPTQPKVPRSVQICISEGSTPTQPKLSRSVQICIFGVVGGGEGDGGGADQLNPKCQDLSKSAFLGGRGVRGWWFRPTFLKYLGGAVKEF